MEQTILSNPWFVGIFGGIISGFLVFFITRRFFSNKDKHEYFQQIKVANNEILYTIRPLIADQCIPEQDILISLINSTAKKYHVQTKDLYNEKILTNDLIKEIIDNPFLKSEQKIQFCKSVKKMIYEETSEKDKLVKHIVLQGNKKNNEMSFMLSLMTASVTMAMVFVLYKDNILGEEIGNFYITLPTVLAISVAGMTSYICALIIMIKKRTKGVTIRKKKQKTKYEQLL